MIHDLTSQVLSKGTHPAICSLRDKDSTGPTDSLDASVFRRMPLILPHKHWRSTTLRNSDYPDLFSCRFREQVLLVGGLKQKDLLLRLSDFEYLCWPRKDIAAFIKKDCQGFNAGGCWSYILTGDSIPTIMQVNLTLQLVHIQSRSMQHFN